MPISECCNVGVVCCDTEDSVSTVAALMRKHHVGDVIVVDEKNDKRVPVGIITDRDIVIETLALDIDAKLFTAGDLMTTPVVTVLESSGFIETLRLMRNHKVRRMPVVTRNGAIFGIVAADDIVRLLAMELSIITDTMAEQTVKEGHLRK